MPIFILGHFQLAALGIVLLSRSAFRHCPNETVTVPGSG